MEEVYDLHRHTHFLALTIRNNTFGGSLYSNSKRKERFRDKYIKKDSYITYDISKTNVLSWGSKSANEKRETVEIDLSGERLYQLFKKGQDKWDKDDTFLFTAVSDFFRLYIEEVVKDYHGEIKDSAALHFVFIVQSDWEEEIREAFIRPIFIQAKLISTDDHQDRLLFCSDVESICNLITDSSRQYSVKMARNTVLARTSMVEENRVLIKLDRILTENPLFDFSGSIMFSKITNSDSIYLTTSDIENGIREYIKGSFSIDPEEDFVEGLMKEMGEFDLRYMDHKKETLITTESILNICEIIYDKWASGLKKFLPINTVKEYSILEVTDKCSSSLELNTSLVNWTKHLFEYKRVLLDSSNIVNIDYKYKEVDHENLIYGAARYVFDAIHNSDRYCKPRVLSTENPTTSLSMFLYSKPSAIMNIDISVESTTLSFSLLDKNGLVKDIWNHDYFVPDIRLRSLGSFFNFSGATTLNIKKSFITFIEEHFTNGPILLFGDEQRYISYKDRISEIESIIHVESHNKNLLISTQQQKHINTFLLVYMIYITYIVSRKLSAILATNFNLKIGYVINIDKVLLKRLFGNEGNLKDMVYTSNLLQRFDGYRKLRITTHEGYFSSIQQSFELQFPLKSFFVVAQLCQDNVQLTLNQVVTDSNLDNKNQESIITKEKTVPTPNIYESLCFNMWSNITEDTSLIQLCDTHKVYNDCTLLEIFTSENQAEFSNNLKEHISKNILDKNLATQKIDTVTLNLSSSCNCKVCLTLNDITEISFRPVLQDIISLVTTSLINNQIFGKYNDIQYVFHLIQFNQNPQFQQILIKILEDETEQFLYENAIEIDHYIIPKSSNQFLVPILQQEPCSYKWFQVGILSHVYGTSFGIRLEAYIDECGVHIGFKNKKSDTEYISISNQVTFPLFRKGDKISCSQSGQIFYLNSKCIFYDVYFRINLFKLKETDSLKFYKPGYIMDTLESIPAPRIKGINFEPKYDVPFIVSVVYKGYASSLSLAIKRSGENILKDRLIELAEPLTLTRF